ncbi:CGNR zinc finger domain-containing protein [Streptomyces sp. NPDC003300]|uniref:CGNR zinc finger domain-containing protein n=1 Tax=unclassified Streptomyces TaxID=2593676 RepID=UPI0033A45D1A
MTGDHLALDLAVTIRHDGHGGVADDLADPAGLTRWVREHADALSGVLGEVPGSAARFTADEAARTAVVAVRTAVRALFARAVLPGPPSRADAGRLPSARQALDRLNTASALVPVAPRLDWPDGAEPAAAHTVSADAAPADRLAAALARAAIAFLAGPERVLLRACPAPRCVRYFVKEHARQEWCKPSCGNRARVARHHARQREERAGQGS